MKKEASVKSFLHGELTEKIIGACFEVSNELGAGFLESVYQKALVIALREKNLKVEAEVPIPVKFRVRSVGDYFADQLVEDCVIVELKAVEALAPEHQAQVINYLKASDFEFGLLVNFGRPKIEYRRLHK